MPLPTSGAISIGDLRTEFYSGRTSASITCLNVSGLTFEEIMRNGSMSGHVTGSTTLAGNVVRGKAKPEFFSMIVSSSDGDSVDLGMAIYSHDDTGLSVFSEPLPFGGQFSDDKTPYKNLAVGGQLVAKYRLGTGSQATGNWVLVFTLPTIAHNFEYTLLRSVYSRIDLNSITTDPDTGEQSVRTKNIIPTRTGTGTWDTWDWVRGKNFVLGPPRELEHFVRRTETADAILCLWSDSNNVPEMLPASRVAVHPNIPNSFIQPGSNTDNLPAYGSTGISLSAYRGQGENTSFIIDQTYSELNLYDWAVAEGWNQTSPLVVTINEKDSSDNDIWLYSDSTANGGLIIDSDFPSAYSVTIINNGKIAGKGGDGNSNPGGPALQILSGGPSAVVINNNDTGFIAGGGGGGRTTLGGGGAGGGTGAGNNPDFPNRGTPGEIGEAGAFGDACGGTGGNTQNGTPGAGGGRILSSTFNTAGASNSSGDSGNGATGGGAWGTNAINGGAGGVAITTATGTTITLTDNGTIYTPGTLVTGDVPPVPFWDYPQQTLINGSTWTKPSSIGDDDWVVFYLIGGGGGTNTAGGTSFGGGGGAYLIAVKGDEVPSSVSYSIGAAGLTGADGLVGGNTGGNVTRGEATTITLTPNGTTTIFSAFPGEEAIGVTAEISSQNEPSFNPGGTGGQGRLYWRDAQGTLTNALVFTDISAKSLLQLPSGSNSPTRLRGGEGGATEGVTYNFRGLGDLPGGNSDWGGAGFSEVATTGVSTFGNAGGSAESGNIRIYWDFTPPSIITLDVTDGNFKDATGSIVPVEATQTITRDVTYGLAADEWRVNYIQSQGGGAYIRIWYDGDLVYTGGVGDRDDIDDTTELTVDVDGTDITFVKGTQFNTEVTGAGATYQRDFGISRDVTSFTPIRNGRAAIVALGAGGAGGCSLRRIDGTENNNAAWGGGAGGMAVSLLNVTTSMTFTCSIGAGGQAISIQTQGAAVVIENGDEGDNTTVSGNGINLKGFGGLGGVGGYVGSEGPGRNQRPILGGIAEGGLYNIQGGRAGDEPGRLIGTHGGSPAQPDFRIYQGYSTQQLSLPSPFEGGALGSITGVGGAGGKAINGTVSAGSGSIYGAGGGGFARSSRQANISGIAGNGEDGAVMIVYFD